MSEAPRHDAPQRTQALTKKSRWPGWIWAVPIAAVAVTGWLLMRAFLNGGVGVTVTFDDAAGMSPKDTKVRYRGVDVGSVSSIEFSKDRKQVIARLSIDDDQKAALNTGTRFYLEGAEVSFADPSSLKSILSGPTIVMVPGEGKPQHAFKGFVGEPPPTLAAAVPYLANFAGAVGELKPGAPVTMRGFTVGKIDHVELSVDPVYGKVSTPVILLLDPTRLKLAAPADGNWAPVMTAALSQLVAHGLRAELTQDPPVVGPRQVTLDMTSDAAAATLNTAGRYPEIPTEGGGGIASVVAQAGKLPLAEIGNNVRAITQHVNALVSAPQLKDTIDQLDQSVARLNEVIAEAGPQIAPMVKSLHSTVDQLRETANQIDATATAMKSMMGGSPAAPNGNLQQALNELSEAGRAVRSLADDLDQHPESLIKGRGASE